MTDILIPALSPTMEARSLPGVTRTNRAVKPVMA